LDFWAFILGMVAGFSFLSRIIKFTMEKCHVFDYSWENYVELHEDEKEKKEEKLDNLEKNSSNAKFIIYKQENSSTELDFKNRHVIDSIGNNI
jgi:hypothetical protein